MAQAIEQTSVRDNEKVTYEVAGTGTDYSGFGGTYTTSGIATSAIGKAPFTQGHKGLFGQMQAIVGVPLATMRDLSKNISLARDEIFDKFPDFICQYHFLENVGKALFKKSHQELTMLFRNLKIKPRLRSQRDEHKKNNDL